MGSLVNCMEQIINRQLQTGMGRQAVAVSLAVVNIRVFLKYNMVAHLDVSELENLCQLIPWNSVYFEKFVVIQIVKNVYYRSCRLRHRVLSEPDDPTSRLVNSFL